VTRPPPRSNSSPTTSIDLNAVPTSFSSNQSARQPPKQVRTSRSAPWARLSCYLLRSLYHWSHHVGHQTLHSGLPSQPSRPVGSVGAARLPEIGRYPWFREFGERMGSKSGFQGSPIILTLKSRFSLVSITLTIIVLCQYSSYYWVVIYLEVSTTEVITVDYIYVFVHCDCVSTKSWSTVLEIGTNRPLKNLKKKMANIGQNIKRMPELHAFKNVLSNVRHSVHCAVHDMRCRRHQKYRYTTFIGPPYTIIFIYSTIITMDTEANFLFLPSLVGNWHK